MPTSALTYFPFTYVGDENIEDFLENRSSYAYSIAFLGTSGMVVTQNNIYGVDLRNLSYVINEFSSYTEIPSAKAVNDRVQEVETVAAEALYDLNSHLEEVETVTALALYDLNDRLDNIGDVINIENQLGNVYDQIDELSSYVHSQSSYIDSQFAYIQHALGETLDAFQDDIDELDEGMAGALYDLNSRVETIDQVTGVAIIDLYSKINNFSSYYNVSYSYVHTFERINNSYVNGILIPIDTAANLYSGDTLSNTTIKPWLSENDKHLELELGGTLVSSYVITECKLIGQCTHVDLSMLQDNGIAKMWSMLPLDIALTTASKVLVKYYNE